MNITKEEYMKIFDYILENYDTLIDDELFSNDFLIQIRNYVKGKRVDDGFMLDRHKDLLIQHFLRYGKFFDEETPSIITDNFLCISRAINGDINSINYIYKYHSRSDEFKNYIIILALSNDYILSSSSPDFLKCNYLVSLNSIKLDCFSSNYVDFYKLSNEDVEQLISELLRTNYTLNEDCSNFLKMNEKVVIHSILIDVNSYKYSGISLYDNYNIFRSLVDGQYSFTSDELFSVPLSYLNNYKTLYYCFDCFKVFFYDDDLFKERLSTLYFDSFTHYPTIESFNGIVNYLSENNWILYKRDNISIFSNVFTKICSMIQSNDSYHDFLIEYKELGNKMKIILKDKFDLLMDSICKYYDIYHSDIRDKSGMESYKTIISRLSSLYIAGSKEYYKMEVRNQFYKNIRKYFKPKIDNKIINKRITQFIRKSIFHSRYINRESELMNFINNLMDKYVSLYGDWIKGHIDVYLRKGYTDFYYVSKKPNFYFDYLKYRKSLKLVTRLNRGYIKYEDNELDNYRDVIVFDDRSKCYRCLIDSSKFNYDQCLEYEKKELTFKKFIKEVMMYINSFEIDENMYNIYMNYADGILDDLPFSDDYYEFDSKYLGNYSFRNLIFNCMGNFENFNLSSLLNDNNFNTIYNILVNNSLIWFFLLKSDDSINLLCNEVDLSFNKFIDIFNNIDKINYLGNSMDMNTNNLSNLLLLDKLVSCCDKRIIDLLGFDVIRQLCTNISYSSFYTIDDIIKISCDLICQMSLRNKSTVPYVRGNYNGYSYSMYDVFDKDVLLTGIFTDSCLRVCGNDNDLFHYCLLNKNGFIIKITNSNGDFIGRAAGFRNGNFIFINQLRTIYDVGGVGYRGKFVSEQKEIVEVLKRACEDIIFTSKNNFCEKIKIDYAFITKSYSFENYFVNRGMSKMFYSLIGNDPVCLSNDDWKNFVFNTKNLIESKIDRCFDSDYGEYDLICLATSFKQIGLFSRKNIVTGDVTALYNRPRREIIVNSNYTDEVIKKINEIRAIYSYYHANACYYSSACYDNSLYIIGDNWYIIYNDIIVDSCVLNDDIAKREFETIKKLLLKSKKDEVVNKIKRLSF